MLEESKSYFEELASRWVEDAYSSSREKLPIGEQRLECVVDIIDKISNHSLNILDIGCGGGQITKALLMRGHKVTAVDRSLQMLALLENESQELPENVRSNLKTIQSCATSLEEKIVNNQYDIIICIGMIYYLENENSIYKIIQKHLKANGTAIITFRNKLFNLVQNSKHQIQNPNELFDLYQQSHSIEKAIDILSFKNYLTVLKEKIDDALVMLDGDIASSTVDALEEKAENEIEVKKILGRQHTPKQINDDLKQFKLNISKLYGIQPHFMLANHENKVINKCLQTLSIALWQLHDAPSSLLWSSHFLVELKHS
ncbi:MAG: class I SAM-dependent methyltransferase [Gammaproteobacteria bacterium]|jgi:2-polyprenyl-3-methyl-5-hydroxy-6-metoxy-1,4-benzoquinol methylase|nr:class I SAM-dependent methyltransferase [Gammaproteobacteria bacterium]